MFLVIRRFLAFFWFFFLHFFVFALKSAPKTHPSSVQSPSIASHNRTCAGRARVCVSDESRCFHALLTTLHRCEIQKNLSRWWSVPYAFKGLRARTHAFFAALLQGY